MSDAESPSDEYEPVEVFPEAESLETDLRVGADKCNKNANCEAECPVAEVDEDFPGPKFQGPEQWRLKRKGDEIDESVMDCSNCMRCDTVCPTGVPLSQMHNTARGQYVENQMDKLSREYIRNRILANYGTSARLASMFPRTANFFMQNSLVAKFMEVGLGIPSERDFPEFATTTFREWWKQRGGPKVESETKRVAYFHGDYANFNTPEVAKSLVRVYESFGYEVAVPPQRCSGTPMFANGMLKDARRSAEFNVKSLSEMIDEGYDIIASCTSCALALRQEYPELFDIDDIERVSNNTYEAVEYLRIHEDLEGALSEADAVDLPDIAYHAPCHGRNLGIDRQAVELFRNLDGFDVEDVGDSCSGISGTFGWKTEHYETSMEIGEEMFDHMRESKATKGMTECPTCSSQMNHGTGYDILHPLQVLEEALV